MYIFNCPYGAADLDVNVSLQKACKVKIVKNNLTIIVQILVGAFAPGYYVSIYLRTSPVFRIAILIYSRLIAERLGELFRIFRGFIIVLFFRAHYSGIQRFI
jgi:hypothetical protein